VTPHRLAPLLLAAALGACCTPPPREDLIVIMPGADGHIGGVVVEAAGAQITLDKPYAGAKPGAAGAMAPVQSSAEEVNTIFKDALAARPIPPKTYTLYFVSGTNDLTPESRPEMDAMLAEIGQRKAAEVVIAGHTDTVGSTADNDRLSLERAKAIEASLRETLAAKGVKSDAVSTVGRGERAPLVKTPDQTPEPKNRRVEITVR
jgi:outer membrane protein OmpA-like peptidoglycan-associated protein